MSCPRCGGFTARYQDEYSPPGRYCVICGWYELTIQPDTSDPKGAAYVEATLRRYSRTTRTFRWSNR